MDENKDLIASLLAKVEALEKKDIDKQKTIDMLYEVADRGRITNYEASRAEKKPFKVKLSKMGDGIIVGWRTVKDSLIKHPTTGRTVGEEQEYEILVMDKDGGIAPQTILGYPAFSAARYDERIEAEVLGKNEGYDGKVTFELSLSDGRKLSLDSRFVN